MFRSVGGPAFVTPARTPQRPTTDADLATTRMFGHESANSGDTGGHRLANLWITDRTYRLYARRGRWSAYRDFADRDSAAARNPPPMIATPPIAQITHAMVMTWLVSAS